MLKQILRDMYVDPEILAALDETYKQTLFCRMREEQIRRWRLWDEEQQKNEANLIVEMKNNMNNSDNSSNNTHNNSNNNNNNKSSTSSLQKRVTFKLGSDGEPWVWIMGEHPNDLTIEDILEQETKNRARQLAETEFRKSVEAQFPDIMDYDKNNIKVKKIDDDADSDMASPKIEDMEIYCSVDELRERIKPTVGHSIIQQNNNNNTLNSYGQIQNVLQEISYNKPSIPKVSARIAQWEQRTIGQRTSEIYKQIQKKKQEVAKEAEEAAKKEDELWKEQQRKAKQAEIQMREIARRAREEHRRSSVMISSSSAEPQSQNSSPPLSLDPMIPRPPNKDAVVQWYRNSEFPKNAGLDIFGRPAKWFYGLLSRIEAETLLANEEQGTFLVRVSEKIWGYAISYKDIDRCKHYLVEASGDKYHFLGQNQLEHSSLGELVRYHTNIPITILGNELLQRPCPSSNTDILPILEGLV